MGPACGLGLVLFPWMWATRRKTSSTSSASSLLRRDVTSSACILFTVIGWSPSLVMTRSTGRIPSSLKCVMKMSAFGEVLYTIHGGGNVLVRVSVFAGIGVCVTGLRRNEVFGGPERRQMRARSSGWRSRAKRHVGSAYRDYLLIGELCSTRLPGLDHRSGAITIAACIPCTAFSCSSRWW